MNAQLAISIIDRGECVFSIGQLEPDAVKELARRVRHGEIARIKTLWPWHSVGIPKTAFCLPQLAQHFTP